MHEVKVEEHGIQTFTDETGEEIAYYAVTFTVVHEGTEYGMVLSMAPGTEPGDPAYVMAIEHGKQTVLAKALQDDSDNPAEQATG